MKSCPKVINCIKYTQTCLIENTVILLSLCHSSVCSICVWRDLVVLYNEILILCIVVGDLFDDESLNLHQIQVRVRLKWEVNRTLELRLILRFMQVLQKSVFKSLVNSDARLLVHIKHLVKQVYCFCRLVREPLCQVHFWLFRQRLNVLQCVLVRDLLFRRLVWSSSTTDDQIDLFDVVLAGEHNIAGHYFTQCAPCRPNVNLVTVFVAWEHDLGSSIITSHYVLCQVLVPL